MKIHTDELATIYGVTIRTIGRWKRAGCPVYDRMTLYNDNDNPSVYDVYDTDEVLNWLKDNDHLETLCAKFNKDNETTYAVDQYELRMRGYAEGLHYAVCSAVYDGIATGDLARLVLIQSRLIDELCDNENATA
jgi:hypothetical protein